MFLNLNPAFDKLQRRDSHITSIHDFYCLEHLLFINFKFDLFQDTYIISISNFIKIYFDKKDQLYNIVHF